MSRSQLSAIYSPGFDLAPSLYRKCRLLHRLDGGTLLAFERS
jgi:hypothetical protein